MRHRGNPGLPGFVISLACSEEARGAIVRRRSTLPSKVDRRCQVCKLVHRTENVINFIPIRKLPKGVAWTCCALRNRLVPTARPDFLGLITYIRVGTEMDANRSSNLGHHFDNLIHTLECLLVYLGYGA